MILFEMQGAAPLLIVPWPPGKGHEENKNFLRGSFKKERHFPSSMWYRKLRQHETCHWIYVDGWRDEVDIQGRSSLFLLSPLIPCYPNTHHSSVTLGNIKNIFHICLTLSMCLPGCLKASAFIVALKHGPVVLSMGRECGIASEMGVWFPLGQTTPCV